MRDLIAANIRSIRLKSGMSVERLASKTRISTHYVYSIERGTSNLSIATLEAIAKTLDCEVCDLVCSPSRSRQNRKGALRLAIAVLEEKAKGCRES